MATEEGAAVAPGRVITLEYTVRLEDGGVLDTTGRCGPVSVLAGAGHLFPPLERRLGGMRAGETREIRIPAGEAYGPWDPDLVRVLSRERLPPELELTVGQTYRLKAPAGKVLRFRLVEVGETEVRADFNAPQAGQALVATVTVLAVRAPTADERRRGRV
jgi:FKBP-type peptidyl-prolyl cis-trans isomerase SlyD